MRPKSAFYIARDEETYIYIIESGWAEVTLKEDAENIVQYLTEEHNLGNRRLIYQDRQWNLDEIIHKDGHFLRFSPGYKGIPDVLISL